MAIKYRELKRLYDLEGPKQAVRHLSEAIEEKHLKPEDFSIRDLAEALVPDGSEWVRLLDPRKGDGMPIVEATTAVDTSAFANITGQLITNKVMEGYQQEQFVMSGLVQTIPTNLDGEKIPGLGSIKEGDIENIQPGEAYPQAGFGEDWVETPSTTKRGLIVPVTKEAIFFDRTNLIYQRAAEVGEVLGLNKEKRILDVVLGIVNTYRWKGVSYNTYYASGDSGPWTNKLTGNELVDWTDVDAAEKLFANILDPVTGEPVLINAKQVLVMPQKRHSAMRVFNATEIRVKDTSPTVETETLLTNPLSGYTWYESRLAYRRLVANSVAEADAANYWLLADFRRAFAYMENWPIQVTQAPSSSEAEFTQDIVLRFKASERGVAAVMNPRYAALLTG